TSAATRAATATSSRRHSVLWYATRGLGILLLVVFIPVGWSLGHALMRPGSPPLGVRTTEWVRDHGGRNIVAWAENTWYDHHKPKKGGVPPLSALPKVSVSPVITPPTTDGPLS